ncbi:DNA translocase FtsK [Cohnella soli]|uniref:DNA translocase FtsK n=1 Tax=Cohnella soli TaxID=425005 RepID=A0ABW0HV25_9BACL
MLEWVVAGGSAAIIAGVQISENSRRKKYRASYRYIRILQHEENVQSVDQIKRWTLVLSEYQRTWAHRQRKGREWFRLLFHKDQAGKIGIYLGFPEDRITGIKNLVKNTYPLAEIHDIPHTDLPLGGNPSMPKDKKPRKKKNEIECGYFDLQQKGEMEGLALQTYAGQHSLEEVLLSLQAVDSEAWLDIMFSPESNRSLKRAVEKTKKAIEHKGISKPTGQAGRAGGQFVEDLKKSFSLDPNVRPDQYSKATAKPAAQQRKAPLSEMDHDDRSQLQTLQKRYTGREAAFEVAIRLLVVGEYAEALAQTTAANIRSYLQMDNGLRFIKNRNMKAKVEERVPYRPTQTFLMTGDEIANLVRLPVAKHRVMDNVPHLKKGQRSLEADELSTGISIGKLIHPIQVKREVKISHTQMNKHFLLVGKTGSGKSSELLEIVESLINDFIDNPKTAPGFTFSDPARDTVATILNRLRQKELAGKKVDWSRVHYFYPADPDYSLPLNLLYHKENEMPDDVVEDVVATLTGLFEITGPRMEHVMRNAVTTLVLDPGQKHSLLGIIPLLRDERFRKRVLARVHEDSIKEFWKHDFPGYEKQLDQVISPIVNRLSPFKTNKLMQRMFGQQEWRLDIRKWMDEGHIVLFNWRGVNEKILSLAGNKITNQYHAEFQGRSTSAKTHYTIWDEAHRTPFKIINKMIAEDRKFGSSCGFSTQFPEQLPGDLLNSFTEIAGNVFTTKLGKKSAGIIQGVTAGAFSAQYLQELPERVVAIFTESIVNGRADQTTFTVECDPPYLFHPDGSGRWANHKDEEEMERAIQWGLEKGRELMARDTTPAQKADELINEYLRPGSILRTQATMAPIDEAPAADDSETDELELEADDNFVPEARVVPSLVDDDDDEAQEVEDDSPAAIGAKDELYKEAAQYVIAERIASVSAIQRRFRVGYTRSARILEALEQNGIVGPYSGSQPREILVDSFKEQPAVNLKKEREQAPESEPASWDELFEKAESLVMAKQSASEDLLQKTLKIDQATAARILQGLEYSGIIGPDEGKRSRKVLVDPNGTKYSEDLPMTSSGSGSRWD